MISKSLLNNLLILFLLAGMGSCKAQLPEYVSAGPVPGNAIDYINWYNAAVESPQWDTVSVYQAPAVSDIRYVIIRPLADATLEISRENGMRIGFICPECIWIDQVTFNPKGEVVSGLQAVTITGGKMIVQYEHCKECKFKPNKPDL